MLRSSRKPNTVFFDLDETLIENRRAVPELFRDVYARYGNLLGTHNEVEYFAALREHAGQLWDSMFAHTDPPEALFARCFGQAAQDIGALTSQEAEALGEKMLNEYVLLSSANVKFHHDALSTITKLRERGITVGIITNGIERIQQGKIDALGLQDKVDCITISAQARAHKPHAPVFEMALERAGVTPDQACQVGDHATNDVAGAIRAGMSGIFYDPSGERRATAFNDLSESPTHVISSLSEVLELVAD